MPGKYCFAAAFHGQGTHATVGVNDSQSCVNSIVLYNLMCFLTAAVARCAREDASLFALRRKPDFIARVCHYTTKLISDWAMPTHLQCRL